MKYPHRAIRESEEIMGRSDLYSIDVYKKGELTEGWETLDNYISRLGPARTKAQRIAARDKVRTRVMHGERTIDEFEANGSRVTRDGAERRRRRHDRA